MGIANDVLIDLSDPGNVFPIIIDADQDGADRLQSRAPFVIGSNHGPRRLRAVRACKHQIAGLRVFVPLSQRLDIDWRKLPDLQRIVSAVVKPFQLHLLPDIQPEFEEVDTLSPDHVFKMRHFIEKRFVFLWRAEPHDGFDTGAVVP